MHEINNRNRQRKAQTTVVTEDKSPSQTQQTTRQNVPTQGNYEADAESVEQISSVANLSQLEMSSIAFIDEHSQMVLHNNLLETQPIQEKKEERNVKIFEDTMASDLAELINEINPKQRRQRE